MFSLNAWVNKTIYNKINARVFGKARRGKQIQGIWTVTLNGVAIDGGNLAIPDYGGAHGDVYECERGRWQIIALTDAGMEVPSNILEVDDCGGEERERFRNGVRFRSDPVFRIRPGIKLPRPRPIPPRVIILPGIVL